MIMIKAFNLKEVQERTGRTLQEVQQFLGRNAGRIYHKTGSKIMGVMYFSPGSHGLYKYKVVGIGISIKNLAYGQMLQILNAN